MDCEGVYKPSSVFGTIHLGRRSPGASCGLPGDRSRWATTLPCLALVRVGFALPRRLPGRAVGSYPTVSPLPTLGHRKASCGRRSVLCGTTPSARAARVLPGTLPCGARTFLGPRALSAGPRPLFPSQATQYQGQPSAVKPATPKPLLLFSLQSRNFRANGWVEEGSAWTFSQIPDFL